MAVLGAFSSGSVLTAAELNAIHTTWTSFTPTFTNVTTTSGTTVGYYTKANKVVHFYTSFTLGASSAISGLIQLTLPNTALRTGQVDFACVMYDSSGGAYYPGSVLMASTSTISLYADSVSGTYRSYVNTSSTVPMTWAVSDAFFVSGTYECA